MKSGKKLILLSMLASSAALTGCVGQTTTKPVTFEPVTSQATAVDPILEIKRISIEARDELRLLAKAEQARTQASMTADQHAQKSFQALHVPKGFEQHVTLDYTAPAEEVAKLIAEAAGYEFKSYGVKPVVSMFVSVKLDDQPLNDALKEVGLQTGNSAILEVYEEGKIIVLNYNAS